MHSGGKRPKLSKRERQRRQGEVIQSHVWNGICDQKLTKRRTVVTFCMSPRCTAHACQHMFARACAHIKYRAKTRRERAFLWFLKVLKANSPEDGRRAEVGLFLPYSSTVTDHFSESNTQRYEMWIHCALQNESAEIDVNTFEGCWVCLPADFYCSRG